MRKKLLVLSLLACLIVCVLCACSENSSSEETKGNTQTETVQTGPDKQIEFVAYKEPETMEITSYDEKYDRVRYENEDTIITIAANLMATPRTYEEHVDDLSISSIYDETEDITIDGYPAVLWTEGRTSFDSQTQIDCGAIRVNTIIEEINMVYLNFLFKDGTVDEEDRDLVDDFLENVLIVESELNHVEY